MAYSFRFFQNRFLPYGIKKKIEFYLIFELLTAGRLKTSNPRVVCPLAATDTKTCTLELVLVDPVWTQRAVLSVEPLS